jgi:hypothetical protein
MSVGDSGENELIITSAGNAGELQLPADVLYNFNIWVTPFTSLSASFRI